jgi:hypothetical protein
MSTPTRSPLASAEVEQCPTKVQTTLTYLDAFLAADEDERPELEAKMRETYFAIGAQTKERA